MDCNEVRELLSPYNDRELSEDEARAITEHLATCRDCAFASGQIADLKRLIQNWEGVKGSREFRGAVVQRTGPQRSGAPGRIIQFALALLAAALLAAGVIFLVLYLQGRGVSLGEFLDMIRGGEETAPAERGERGEGAEGAEGAEPETGEAPGGLRLPGGLGRSLGDVTAAGLSGNVFIEDIGGKRRPLAAGEAALVGESGTTSADAVARLDVGGRYRAVVGRRSSVTIGTGSVRLRSGMMVVTSAPAHALERGITLAVAAFEIELAPGEVKSIAELSPGGGVRLVLLRGSAEVRRAGRLRARASAGQEIKVDATGRLSGPSLHRGGDELEGLEWKD